MLVTRAATDEEYANSVEKLYMSFQQLNRIYSKQDVLKIKKCVVM